MKRFFSTLKYITIITLVALFVVPVFAENLSSGMDAAFVLGQPDFETNSASTTASKLGGNPQGVAYDADHDRLFVADSASGRILVFNVSGGITNGMSASAVLGQATMTDDSRAVAQDKFSSVYGLAYDPNHNYLFAADYNGNRVLVFDVASITNGENAIHVLGQEDYTSSTATVDQDTLNSPRDVAYDVGTDFLYVADQAAARIMVYDLSAGITNGMDAAHVLGQANFTDGIDLPIDANTVGDPLGVAVDELNSLLYVADANGAHRVLVFDIAAVTNNESAIHVLGQPDFSSDSLATDQNSLNYPQDVSWDPNNERLFVSEDGNIRVVAFDLSNGITDGENAIAVLGQPNFTSQDGNYGGTLVSDGRGGFTVLPSQKGFASSMEGVAYDTNNDYLFVSDEGNNRVMVFNLAPVNADPTDIELSASSIAEDQASGSTVGTLSATDADVGDSATFSLACTTPGADDASFSITGTSLKTATALDYETKTSYGICVRVTDGSAGTYDEDFTITVTDVSESSPTPPRSGGSSGGGVARRCHDPRATNYDDSGRDDPSRCTYATGVTPTPVVQTPSTQETCPAGVAELQGKLTKIGDRGAGVLVLQKILNCKMKAGLVEDSIFGRMTDAATKAFQLSRNIKVDGVVGPITISELQK